MPQFQVYGLFDPRTGELRYVGKSSTGLNRPRHHQIPWILAKDRTPRGSWLKSLRTLGLRAEIDVLEHCDSPEALIDAERWHIAYWRGLGARLTNLLPGGEGLPLGYRHSDETKAKMKATRSKPEVRARMSRASGGRPFVDETGRVWHVQGEAAEHFGIPQSYVQRVLSGERAQTLGHTFRYVESA